MNRYPRLPAVLVVLVSALFGVLYVVAWGDVERFFKQRSAGAPLEAIRRQIDDLHARKQPVPASVWHSYGDALFAAREYSPAVEAYRQVLTVEPANKEVKFEYGLALALAGRGEEFLAFQEQQVTSDPNLAVRLFDRPEVAKYLSDPRFAACANSARYQAMD